MRFALRMGIKGLGFALLFKVVYCQNVGIGTTSPHPSALLDLADTTGGFLLPRLTTVQRDAIANPAVSLLIFNVDSQCLEMWNGQGWETVFCFCTDAPPVVPIQGNTTICIQDTGYLWVIPVVGVRYRWQVSGVGWQIVAGQGTNVVGLMPTIDSPAQVSLIASNACGSVMMGPVVVQADTPPGAPQGLIAWNTGSGWVLTWQSVPNATSYQVEIAYDANFTQLVPGFQTTTTDTFFQVSGLSCDSQYYWRVRAFTCADGPWAVDSFIYTCCEGTSVTNCLVAWWKMNQTSGNQVPDASGNNYHGTANGGYSWVNGHICQGLQMNGNAYVTTNFNPQETQPFTVTAWIRIASGSGEKMIVGTCSSAWNGFWFEVIGTSLRSYFSNGSCDNTTAVGLNVGVWYHVALVYTGSQVIHYLNGSPVGTYSCTSTSDSGAPLYIGAIGPYSTTNWLFNGVIDDLRFYNCALTSAQIQQIYQGQ